MKNMNELEQRIAAVEEKRDLQWHEITATADLLAESLKPQNVIKQVFDENFGDGDIAKIAQRMVSIASGFLVHHFTIGKKGGFIFRIFGRAWQTVVTSLINKVLRQLLPLRSTSS